MNRTMTTAAPMGQIHPRAVSSRCVSLRGALFAGGKGEGGVGATVSWGIVVVVFARVL